MVLDGPTTTFHFPIHISHNDEHRCSYTHKKLLHLNNVYYIQKMKNMLKRFFFLTKTQSNAIEREKSHDEKTSKIAKIVKNKVAGAKLQYRKV